MAVKTGQLQQQSELPKLSGIQFDTNGDLVNIFRGTVSFPVQLLSLPGRNGLNFSASLFYQSDQAAEQIDKWDLTNPSSIAGIGWELPFERIVIEPKANGALEDNQYFWVMAGQPTPLIPRDRTWQLGVLNAEFQVNLVEDVVGPALRLGLKDQQILVAEDAFLYDRGGQLWELKDTTNKRNYFLKVQENGIISVETGGITFELYNYQYWRISYYQEYERWEIIKNDGGIYSFGGLDAERIDPSIPANTVQYGIRWGNWIGPSTEVTGQERYVKAWNLAKVQNTLGNYYLVNYDALEQQVGTGLTYTKSCWIRKAKNDLGWAVEYVYGDKIYDNSVLDAPKEYLDPHKDPEDPKIVIDEAPDGYQSSYLVKYLKELKITNNLEELQAYTRLEYYDLWNPNVQPDVNASKAEKLAYGATFGRYLKSITQYAAESYNYPEEIKDRYSIPGILFKYNIGNNIDNEQPLGLLKEIINPNGGSTTFKYTNPVGQDGIKRAKESRSTFTNASTAAVRTWYGQDYVVCCWYDNVSNSLDIKVYTWAGKWIESDVTPTNITDISIDLDRLQVIPSQNTFLVVVASATSYLKNKVYLCQRDKLQNATWTRDTVNRAYEGSQLKVSAGNDFFIVQSDGDNKIDRYTWDALNQQWIKAPSIIISSGLTYYNTAGENYYVLFAHDPSTEFGVFSLFYRDIYGRWIDIPKTLNVPGINIAPITTPHFNGFGYFQMSPSQSFVAISIVTGYTMNTNGGFDSFDYEVRILSWDTNYNLNIVDMSLIEGINEGRFNNLPSSVLYSAPGIGPVPINNAAIGTGPNYIYFNGKEWRCKSLGIDYEGFADLAHQYYWYAYDEQGIIKTENTDSGIISKVGTVDPSNANLNWHEEVLLDDAGHIVDRYNQAFPSNGGQYITLGNTIYSKPLSSNWGNLTPDRILIDDLTATLKSQNTLNQNESIDITTVVNTGEYLAFLILDEKQKPKDTGIIYFRNGIIVKDGAGIILDRLEGQTIFQMFGADHIYKNNINGKLSPIINGLITCPKGSSLDATASITLNKYSGEDFVGSISGWVVDSITYNTGYDQTYKCYKYEASQCATDGYRGSILKFYKVTEYNGCATPASQNNKDGYVTSYFYNGLPVEPGTGQAVSSYSMLDGQLQKKEIYDSKGLLKASTETFWNIIQEISFDSNGNNLQKIYGAIPQVREVKSMQEEIWNSSTTKYSSASGNPIETSASYYDSQGRKIINTARIKYAYEVYGGIWNQNNLVLQAQSTSYIKPADQPESSVELGSSQIQTYKLWDLDSSNPNMMLQWGAWKSYIATAPYKLTIDGPEEAPPFSYWDIGEPDSTQWTKTNEILTRNKQGGVTASKDVEGKISTSIYDNQNNFVLAAFENAILEDGISYTSFEDYQTLDWTFSTTGGSGTGYSISSDAFTGNKCYHFNATGGSTSSISKIVSVQNTNQYYNFNLWYKTPKDADAGDVVKLEVTAVGSSTPIISDNIDLTAGEWKPYQWIVNLDNLGVTGPVDVTLSIKITSATAPGWLRVDDVIFSPVLSPFAATAYDMDKLRTAGSVSRNGVSGIPLYNMWAQYSAVGAYNQTTAIGSNYSMRQDINYDILNPEPNLSISIGGRDKGFYDLYKSNESLGNYTAVDGSKSNWSVSNNTLKISTGSEFQVLELSNYSQQDLSLYVTAIPYLQQGQSNPSQIYCVGIKGTNGSPFRFIVQWNGVGAANIWQILKWDGSSSDPVPVATNDTVAWQPEWMLTVFEDRLFFTANGILIFNYQDPDLALSQHTVQLGTYYYDSSVQGEVGFKNLTVVDDIQMSMTYSDGMGRPLQSLAVESSASVIMTPSVYDYLGRPAISVLPSRVQQGVNGVANPFNYYPGFINNGGSGGSLWSDEPIDGDINNYHEDAEGYPFSRTVYEKSPLGRPLSIGSPGKKFAIRDLDPTEPNDKLHITTYEYDVVTQEPGFLFRLYPTQDGDCGPKYYVTIVKDPDGNQNTQYTTTAGQVIGTIVTGPNGENPIKSSSVYDMKGQLIGSIPPNYYQDVINPQAGNFTQNPPMSNYATTYTYDFWGRKIQEVYPDSGLSIAVFDIVGRPRFMQDARGLDEGYFSYIKYDELGRNIERGVYTGNIDPAKANDQTWPLSSDPNRTCRLTNIYDGDDTTLYMVGRLWKEITYNGESGDEATVTNTYQYLLTGEVSVQTQEAIYNNGSEPTTSTCYHYTINGRLDSIRDDITDVIEEYKVNKLGQTIETSANNGTKHVKAVYTYNQLGKLKNRAFYTPNDTLITDNDYLYQPNGWLTDIASDNGAYVVQDLKYVEGNCDVPSKGYYNGALSHNTVTYQNIPNPQPQLYDYCYSIDHLNRVTRANNTSGMEYSWEFDGNSNIKSYDAGSEIRTYTYDLPYKNKLDKITSTLGDVKNFYYDEVGNLLYVKDNATPTQNTLLSISYNNWSFAKARQIEKPQQNIKSVFDYDAGDNRVRKRLYLNNNLIKSTYTAGKLEFEYDYVGQITQTKRYITINGGGLIYCNDTFYWVLPDHLGSSRVLMDESGVVQYVYNYDVYGVPTITTYNGANLIFNNLFTGQYWDGELELYDYGARFYDPVIGRFLQVDPAHQFFNPYSYVGGMPNMATDPTGMWSWQSILALAGGIAFTLGAIALTALTWGATAPLTVVGVGIITGAAAGAGIASTMYAATHQDNFDVREWALEAGLAAGFGAIGGAFGGRLALAGMTASKAFIANAAFNLASGVIDGYVSNGSTNALHGRDFNEGGGEAAGWGALMGGGPTLVSPTLKLFSKGLRNTFRYNNIKFPKTAAAAVAAKPAFEPVRMEFTIPGTKITRFALIFDIEHFDRLDILKNSPRNRARYDEEIKNMFRGPKEGDYNNIILAHGAGPDRATGLIPYEPILHNNEGPKWASTAFDLEIEENINYIKSQLGTDTPVSLFQCYGAENGAAHVLSSNGFTVYASKVPVGGGTTGLSLDLYRLVRKRVRRA